MQLSERICQFAEVRRLSKVLLSLEKKNRICISKEIKIAVTDGKKIQFKTFTPISLLIQFPAHNAYIIVKTATKLMSNNSQSRLVKIGLDRSC